ncbi:hypothetical protein A2291_00670 [candidate division WOR-1 bacterium RIFOXYB2_FULL_42_35]|uniref:Citrate transporter-like domain-containing protein n=1 Tax=candidate division WOR-1 bacterium RIFOXYC2_FULL_41_25 TaxID=1802586 RepID=A0A1F4TJV3_UNCSA|nr:MAG: hypothetical protein A2247_06945 [candidate division WOR-1 bacterium RIFOXYA2_FULL_41_14]OGC23482.1 MAG: hypothetical protein A2291_00670 [candidate division WOR-1 bacterium RIFOXYB2_FULL_42_35]OGC33005.1 MAG: hypothetical protein A2462_03715 [candidate division WOR-1 bacterium RIFOXYC2_FULL_41_25]
MKLITSFIFLLSYLFLIFSKQSKAFVAWLAVVFLLVLQILSPGEAFWAVNWNVIGLFVGTLLVAELFIYSQVPAYLANLLVAKSKNAGLAILAICVLASLISIFVENVATVLIVAPIALALAERLKISPIPALIGIAISSNLQGTATLIGDPPSMILAGFANLNFMDFFVYLGKPSIFFAVELGAIPSFVVLYLIFKKFKEKVVEEPKTAVISWVPTLLLILMIVGLASIAFWPIVIPNAAAIVALLYGLIGLLWFAFHHKQFEPSVAVVKNFDYETLLFLMAIFILVSSLTKVGLLNDLAGYLQSLSFGNPFIAYTLIVWLSVFFSAFIDNVPYVLAMLPVTSILAASLGISPSLLNFGLLIGACLGGNITPIGASANIVACGMLKKRGYHVGFWDFVKIGLPFTIASVLVSYVFLWIVWR